MLNKTGHLIHIGACGLGTWRVFRGVGVVRRIGLCIEVRVLKIVPELGLDVVIMMMVMVDGVFGTWVVFRDVGVVRRIGLCIEVRVLKIVPELGLDVVTVMMMMLDGGMGTWIVF